MLNPYVVMASAAFIVLLAIGSYQKGRHDMDAVWKERALVAEQQARAREHQLQEATDAITKRHQQERTRISGRLADALERLRDRPARSVPEDSPPACIGGDGRSLSAEDAGFLVREAARADELRVALEACQAWANEVTTATSRER